MGHDGQSAESDGSGEKQDVFGFGQFHYQTVDCVPENRFDAPWEVDEAVD